MLLLLKAPLLPKLRGHFAEFLSESSLERLRILSSPTCVGLRYGHHELSTRGSFLGRPLGQFASLRNPVHPEEHVAPDLPGALRLPFRTPPWITKIQAVQEY